MSANFQCRDAILDLYNPDNPTEPDWPRVDFIVGNPPFLGGSKLWKELGRDYQEQLWQLYKGRVPGAADLCCYWFEKARAHIAAGKCKRAGLLATQSIRGGANREVLKLIKESGDIFWAVSDRNWILDGAAVHVSIVAFDSREETTRTLDGIAVSTINANLTASADITTACAIPSMANLSFSGTKKAGGFNISEKHARELLVIPNPHGKPNSDILKPWLNGTAIVQRPTPQWIIDCGVQMTLEEFQLYDAPHQYAVTHIKPERDKNKRAVRRLNWWLHAELAPAMRTAISKLSRYIATPRVSKYRIFTWNDPIVLPDDGIFIFANADNYFFGVLQSRIHEVWTCSQGTQVRERESGFRYTPTTCFETFPMPEPTREQENVIAEAARQLNDLRERWLNPPEWTREEVLEFPGTPGGPWSRYIAPGTNTVRYPRIVPKDDASAASLKKRTLTNLYNERPAWLDLAHQKLDAAVFAAYGWDPSMPDADLLAALLALNHERGGRETLNQKPPLDHVTS
jgi:type II restriction/modification system DNA methylase subunit YeeA